MRSTAENSHSPQYSPYSSPGQIVVADQRLAAGIAAQRIYYVLRLLKSMSRVVEFGYRVEHVHFRHGDEMRGEYLGCKMPRAGRCCTGPCNDEM